MKIWVDDVRFAPRGYVWCNTVYATIATIQSYYDEIEEIDLDHDAGDFAVEGGDYIRILDWLEATYHEDMHIRIKIHSMNPVGVANMKRIINKNGWLN